MDLIFLFCGLQVFGIFVSWVAAVYFDIGLGVRSFQAYWRVGTMSCIPTFVWFVLFLLKD
jgi:hypothetical protein